MKLINRIFGKDSKREELNVKEEIKQSALPLREDWDMPKDELWNLPSKPFWNDGFVPNIKNRTIGYPDTSYFIELRMRCIEAASNHNEVDVISSAKDYLAWIMEEYIKPQLPNEPRQ